MQYEILLRRGFKCEKGKRKGANAYIYDNFASASVQFSNAPNDAVLQRKFNKELDKIKGYISNSLNHSLKRLRNDQAGTAAITTLIGQINSATNRADVDTVITEGLAAFNTYNIHLPPI